MSLGIGSLLLSLVGLFFPLASLGLGGLSLPLGLSLADPLQPVLPPLQLLRQLVAPLFFVVLALLLGNRLA